MVQAISLIILGLALPTSVIPAAQYLRTSTRQQEQSLETQEKKIQDYAAQNGFVIVRTYVDRESGLQLRNRPGLSNLLHDIAYGDCDFRAVLVFDVSRWGRFQNGDEGAHYEFLCKVFGVDVHYCSESFINDNEIPTFILKSLKRSMAAEYSRDLSAKCFLGQRKLVKLGFIVGADCKYGYRRMAVSADASRTQILCRGESKSLSADHIKLVLGPDEEVQAVRQIFRMSMAGKSSSAIAAEMNRRQISYRPGRPWADHAIQRILRDRGYTGTYTWNRTTRKLGTREKRNPPEQWIVVPDAFPAIVSVRLFDHAQALRRKSPRYTEEQVLDQLRRIALHFDPAKITAPSLWTLRQRLVGLSLLRSRRGTSWKPGMPTIRQTGMNLRNRVFDELLNLFPKSVSEFHLPGKSRPLLKLKNGTIVSVLICRKANTVAGLARWRLDSVGAEREFVALICLGGAEQVEYFMLPYNNAPGHCVIGTHSPLFRMSVKLAHLEEFYRTATALAKSRTLREKP